MLGQRHRRFFDFMLIPKIKILNAVFSKKMEFFLFYLRLFTKNRNKYYLAHDTTKNA